MFFYTLELDRAREDDGASLVVMHRVNGEDLSNKEIERALEICAAKGGTWFGEGETIPLVEFYRCRHSRVREETVAVQRMAVRVATYLQDKTST